MVEDLVGVENEYIDSQTITGKITRILSRQVFKYTITSVKTGKKFVLSDSDIFIFFTTDPSQGLLVEITKRLLQD